MKRALILIAMVVSALMVSSSAQQSPSQQQSNQQSTKSTDSTPPADTTKPKSAAEKFPFPEAESPSSPPRSTDTKPTDGTKPKSAAEEFPFPEAESPNAPPRSEPRNPNDSSSKDRDVDISPPSDDNKHEGSDLVGPDAAPGVTEMKPWDPHKADKDLEIGMFYLRQKNYSAAESRFREALTWQDNHAEATYRLAAVLEKEGKIPQAKQYYLQYLQILPEGPFAKDSRKALNRVSSEGSQKAENKAPTSQP